MPGFWVPFDQRKIVSPAWILFPLFEALFLLPSITAFQPTRLRTIASTALFVSITWAALRFRFEAPFVESYLFLSLHGTMLCNWLDRVVLQHPDKEQWHRIGSRPRQDPKDDHKWLLVPQSYWTRWRWSFEAGIAIRGVGWSHQVKNVPQAPHVGYSHWKFVLTHLIRFVTFKILEDQLKAYAATTPFGGYWDEAPYSPPELFSLPLYMQFMCCWMCAIQVWAGMNMATSLIYAVSVALGIWEPHQCAPIFGDWREFYTVRKAWSVVWHQLCRRIATTAGIFIARTTLKLQPGTFSSRYVQLFAGFFATGLFHSMGSIFAIGYDIDLWFFIMQAVAIMAEDHIIVFGHRMLGLKENRLWRIVGFLWVLTWFSYSLRLWYGPQAEMGIWVNRRGTDWLRLDSNT